MNWLLALLLVSVSVSAGIDAAASPQTGDQTAQPVVHSFASSKDVVLQAHVFHPVGWKGPRPAIVIFHGGGWAMGEPEWAYPLARHFAQRGMVAVAAQYRLSDQKEVTPLEAMADARAAIGWVRRQADSLGVDPKRVAAYGWSAGAHLAVSTAIFIESGAGSAESVPDALVLVSPAVSLESDAWFRKLLGDRAQVVDVSPDRHVRPGLPPVLILQGDVDTVTPLPGVQRFCQSLREAGNTCAMHVYEGFGHLFTPAGVPDEWPKPDPATRADALARADLFLASLDF